MKGAYMKKTLLVMNGLLVVFSLSAQMARGKVYEDVNRNGKRDRDEKGIARVAVSNGTEVVLTGEQGDYAIDAAENTVLFVIKPPDYQYACSALNLPLFYYHHYPIGGPDLKGPGIAPTGPLPAAMDFGLVPAKHERAFKVLIMGDTQVGTFADVDFLGQDIIAGLAGNQQFAFGTILGDLINDNQALYEPLNQVMAGLGIPMFNVQGNHDMNYRATHDRWASETFKSIYGPKNYAFNYGEVHFIVLDNIIYSGDTVQQGYIEGFDQEAITFVRNDLRHVPEDRLVVLMMHAPFINEYTNRPIPNLSVILEELARFPHTFSISGHNHTVSQQLIGLESGWTGTRPHHHFNTGATCGNWWSGIYDESGVPDATMYDGTPNGYAVASFDGNSYTIDYRVARRPDELQMHIYLQPDTGDTYLRAGSGAVYVNFFTGSENDRVSIRFDGGQELTMNRVVEPDPGYVGLYRLWENKGVCLNGREMPGPQPCLHLWKISLPALPKTGMHKAEVTATDLFGRRFTATRFFRISE